MCQFNKSESSFVKEDFTGLSGELSRVTLMNAFLTASVKSLTRREAIKDYLDANFSCPAVMPGVSKYQFVGPDHEFSTCYYVKIG